MIRYPHYYWPVKGSYCPSRIAVVIIDAAPDLAGILGKPHGEKGAHWCMTSADMYRGRCTKQSQYTGKSGGALLSALASLCTRKQTSWVLIPNCVRSLALCGFFNALSERTWKLTGSDWKVDRGCGNAGEDTADGLCVISDPPTLISAQPTGAKGKLLLLDTANYGLDSDTTGLALPAVGQEYLSGILSCVQTLRTDRPVSLRGTAASQAMQILRTRYDCVRLHCHCHAAATALERAAYFGGRCEAYRVGRIDGPVYHVDVRSMYPALGLTLAVPVSLREYTDDPNRARAIGTARPGDCIASVRVRTNVPAYPHRIEDRIDYRIGEFDTALAGPELCRAVKECSVVGWYGLAHYSCAPILSGFFRDMLALTASFRQAGNSIGVQWSKRVTNAIVGKFGEPGRRWVGVPSSDLVRTERGDYAEWTESDGTRYRNIAGYCQREEQHGESYHSIPAIAAFICSAGRCQLWNYISDAGFNNTWYVDTDSLVTNENGFQKLLSIGAIRNGQEGYLRLIGKHSQCTIHGIRHYEMGGIIKCAGVAHGAIGEGETREEYFSRNPGTAETTVGMIRRMSDAGT